VKFSQSTNDSKNRPVAIHRPVLALLFLLSFFLFAPGSKSQAVFAQTAETTPTATPVTQTDITLPKSGEPVIFSPGNNARLISPLKLKVAAKPGEDGMIRIELIGHDNRLIFRKLLSFLDFKGKTLLIEQEIPFEIRADEPARLQIVLENSKGKPIYITSVGLMLVLVQGSETSGEAPVNPRFKIEQPTPGQTVQGEFLVIKGGIKPINNTPIVVELMASDWHTLTSKIVSINIPTDQTAFTLIDVNLPFKTGTQIPATLRIRQESNSLINGTVLLWSEKLTLVK
jgi:hypothetical protein